MAMACLVLRAPCLPSRMWSISSCTNSPAWVLGAFPSRASFLAFWMVLFSGIYTAVASAMPVCRAIPVLLTLGWVSDLFRLRQKPPNAVVIRCCAQNPAKDRTDDGNPENFRTIGEAVVLEAGDGREQTRAKVARRIDGVTVHASERHADSDNHCTDQHRREIRSRRLVPFVDNGKYQQH